MDVIQLLNPILPLETPLQLRQRSAKNGQQPVARFIHIPAYHAPSPVVIEHSDRAVLNRQRRRLAARRLRDSKRTLREELARTQQQLEHAQLLSKQYEEEINCLRQKLRLSAGDADTRAHSTGWHEQRSTQDLHPYTTTQRENILECKTHYG